MKILHLCFMRNITPGQLKQIQWEKSAQDELKNWSTLVYHDYPSIGGTVKQIPWLFRNVFLRNMFAWYTILKVHKKFDYLLVRHLTFDIYSLLFSGFVNNRVTIHHAKEIDELKLIREGWKGKFASYIEYSFGGRLLKKNKAIIGVTSEIAQYQAGRADFNLPSFVYPNGVNYSDLKLLPDLRDETTLNLFFICGKFSSWHGLDIILNAMVEHKSYKNKMPIRLHLIGDLTSSQIEYINNDAYLSSVCCMYGRKSQDEYGEILSFCDVGLGSFALFRKNLQEASTLKVREMLASGLPVISGHNDTALPEDFLFYKNLGNDINFVKLYNTFKGSNKYERAEVRSMSKIYINKKDKMEAVIEFLSSI